MDFREGHRQQVNALTEQADDIMEGKEVYTFRHPNDPTRIVKIAQPRAMIHSYGLGGLKLRPYNRENPAPWVRREFLRQYLLTRILHRLFPSEIPDAFNVKTKSIPRTEKQFVEGKTLFQVRNENAAVPADPYELDPFMIGENEDMEQVWAAFTKMAKWNPAYRRMESRMEDLGIRIDPANVGRNFLRLDDGTFMYVDNFVSPNPKKTAGLLRKKVAAMGEGVTNPEEKERNDKEKARCEHWLDQYEKLASHNTKMEAFWDQLVAWAKKREN